MSYLKKLEELKKLGLITNNSYISNPEEYQKELEKSVTDYFKKNSISALEKLKMLSNLDLLPDDDHPFRKDPLTKEEMDKLLADSVKEMKEKYGEKDKAKKKG